MSNTQEINTYKSLTFDPVTGELIKANPDDVAFRNHEAWHHAFQEYESKIKGKINPYKLMDYLQRHYYIQKKIA